MNTIEHGYSPNFLKRSLHKYARPIGMAATSAVFLAACGNGTASRLAAQPRQTEVSEDVVAARVACTELSTIKVPGALYGDTYRVSVGAAMSSNRIQLLNVTYMLKNGVMEPYLPVSTTPRNYEFGTTVEVPTTSVSMDGGATLHFVGEGPLELRAVIDYRQGREHGTSKVSDACTMLIPTTK